MIDVGLLMNRYLLWGDLSVGDFKEIVNKETINDVGCVYVDDHIFGYFC